MKTQTRLSSPRRCLRQPFVRRCSLTVLLALLLSSFQMASAATPAASGEARTAQALEAARKQGPLALRAFLAAMPKGGDLHNHLAGAVYAESWIRAAGEDGLCVDQAALSFARKTQQSCGNGSIDAALAPRNQPLYDALIDSFSMRSFVPSTGVSGHDHFFASFGHFSGVDPRHTGEWLDEVASRAAAQNEQYLELMETPPFARATSLAHELGWQPDLAKLRDALLSHGLRDEIAADRAHLEAALALRGQLEHCGTPQAQPACAVEIRFLYQVLRGFPREQVFAQTLLGFEVASVVPEVVGINFVMPEDGYISMTDYREQMRMLDFLHGIYPRVHITLHAGELAPGLVPPEGLRFHIRAAIEQGHAERIGHGVDVAYEDRSDQLLREMASRHVMVEINLTSNDVILGVAGSEHPLPLYRRYGVPVALSTDDEGVSRIDLTHEYVRAVTTYALGYRDLKQMVRASIEHSFLPGASLWKQPDRFAAPVRECAGQALGSATPSGACTAFLKSSERAQQQWELERRFREFEGQAARAHAPSAQKRR